MEVKPVEKVYPKPEELSSVCSKVKCPQENCKAIFRSSANLNMHLIKHHKVNSNELTAKNTEMQYFCPIQGCPYYKDSKKHFVKFKYLKQHFLKVHALKEFLCKKCGKKFSTESFRNSHVKICGKLFTCSCGSTYTSSEALLTHCKRKGKDHYVVEKLHNSELKNSIPKNESNNNAKRTERFIYPKLSKDLSFPIHYVAAIALSELSKPCNLPKVVDKGIQTEVYENTNNKDKIRVPNVKCDKKRKNSQQTQTLGKYKKLKISTQTQTNIDYLKHKGKTHPKTIIKKRKKSMETQTKDDNPEKVKQLKVDKTPDIPINSKDKSIALEEEKARKWLWDNNFFPQKDVISPAATKTTHVKSELFNMSTELSLCGRELDLNLYTNISSKNNGNQYESGQGSDHQIFDRLCNIETQTEIDTFLTDCNEDTTFTLCSTTETQTTDDFDSLLYSNMCTQTCEEVDQLFNFNFVHIETQTAWPDLNDCSDLES